MVRSIIRQRSFEKFTKKKSLLITTPWNFPDGPNRAPDVAREDQQATVLQLPAEPRTVVESEAQHRATYVG